jgi:hypothetical protein
MYAKCGASQFAVQLTPVVSVVEPSLSPASAAMNWDRIYLGHCTHNLPSMSIAKPEGKIILYYSMTCFLLTTPSDLKK